MHLPILLLLAQTPPADPQSYQSAGWLLLGLGGLALALNQIVSLILNWRKIREPEPDQCSPADCIRLQVLEQEIRAVEMRMEKRLGEHLGGIGARLQSLETTLQHVVRDFNYVLGKIDAKQED